METRTTPSLTSPATNDAKPLVAPEPMTSYQSLNIMDSDSDTNDSEDDSVIAQFVRLHKRVDSTKERNTQPWHIIELINQFNIAHGYTLSKKDEQSLYLDMKAAADLLEAAEAFNDSKDGEHYSLQAKANFQDALKYACVRAALDRDNPKQTLRATFTKIGALLGVMAISAAVAVFAAGLSPFIIAGCFIAGVVLMTTAAISHYHQCNHTFFGQSDQNRVLLADLVATESCALDPKTVGCCG